MAAHSGAHAKQGVSNGMLGTVLAESGGQELLDDVERLRELTIAGVRVRALRVTYVGELGWELHMPIAAMAPVYDSLMAAGEAHGIANGGYRAIESLRLEKGYRAWGADLDTGRDPFQSGLGFTVHRGKEGYVGRDAVERLRDEDPRGRDRLRCLTVDDAATVRDLLARRMPPAAPRQLSAARHRNRT